MTRKRTRRQVITPMAPRGLRPMFTRATLTSIALAHHETLYEIAKGGASEATLWHMVEAAFTWQRVATKLGIGEPEMLLQLQLATQVVERYRDRGVICFTGPEYQMAKLGVQVMDALAEQVANPRPRLRQRGATPRSMTWLTGRALRSSARRDVGAKAAPTARSDGGK